MKITFLLAVFTGLAFSQQITIPDPHELDERLDIYHIYKAAIDPQLPENNYWPKALKKRLGWLFESEKEHRLDIIFHGEELPGCRYCLMFNSRYPQELKGPHLGQWYIKRKGIPYIDVSLGLFFEIVRNDMHIPKGEELLHGRRPMLTLAIAFAHEKIHLDGKKSARNMEELVIEETRTRFIEAVEILKPLSSSVGWGDMPYGSHLYLAIVADCDFKMPCEELESTVRRSLRGYDPAKASR